MKSISLVGVVLASSAFAATLLLGACATPPEQPGAAKQASAQSKDDDGDITTGSRLKSKSGQARPDMEKIVGPIQTFGNTPGMRGN